jgi:hypothetical protein
MATPHGLDGDDVEPVDHSPDAEHRIQTLQPAYYPGVRDPGDATAVEVSAGNRVNGIDITLTRSRVFRLSGKVVIPAGVEAERLSLRTGSWSDFSMNDRSTSPARDGKFELRAVPSGSYDVTVNGKAGRRMYLARSRVVVGDSDVEGVRLELSPGPEVTGRITVDGKPPAKWGQIHLAGGTRRYSAEVVDDATFTASVLPGRYDVIYSFGDDGLQTLFVKSIAAGSVDVFHQGLIVSESGTVALDVVLSADAGSAEGVVLDADDKPLGGITVVLVPESALRGRYDLFREVSSDQNGHFDLKSIPPGEYKLFAWEDVEPGIWQDPEFLKDQEKNGQAITIRKDGHENARLHIPR